MTSLLLIAAIGQSCIAAQQTYAPIQYQQNYAQPYVQNAYIEKVVFVPVEAQDAPAYFGGLVAQQQRAAERQQQAQQVQSTADQKIDQLTRLVLDLQKRLESQQNEPPIPSKPAAPVAEPARPTLPALSPVASESVPPPPTVAQAASSKSAGLALLAQKCAGCHHGTAAKGGGHILFAADGSFIVRDRDLLERIDTAISSGSMPKGKQQQLTLREYVSIRDFLGEQASALALNTTNPRKKIR
jgi:mono/diheme cytochrome c family protein